MACELCTVSFSPPSISTPSHKLQVQSNGTRQWAMHLRSSSSNRVSNQATWRTAINCLGFSGLITSSFTRNREHHNNLLKSSSHHCGPVSCVHTMISGYWVGPDVEDGWGYVEASVNEVVTPRR